MDGNRDFAETSSMTDKLDYQKFEHEPIDLLVYAVKVGAEMLEPGFKSLVSARIFCPDVRVIARIAIVFQPIDPADRATYNLSELGNDVVAYHCLSAGQRIVRVGEIIGKNGVPKVFPLSNIDGIGFEDESDNPTIDVDLNLGFPGVPGKWVLYYHTTSNNKLKAAEWQSYISRVNVGLLESPGVINYNNAPG
jgi:hypothetical protein